jgi:hypothetical protein
VEAARRALALRRAAQFAPSPPAGETAHEGMQPLPSRRRRTSVLGRRSEERRRQRRPRKRRAIRGASRPSPLTDLRAGSMLRLDG